MCVLYQCLLVSGDGGSCEAASVNVAQTEISTPSGRDGSSAGFVPVNKSILSLFLTSVGFWGLLGLFQRGSSVMCAGILSTGKDRVHFDICCHGTSSRNLRLKERWND